MARGLLLFGALLSVGCASPVTRPGGPDALAVRGRVVDAESCASTIGCEGVAGVVVAVWDRPELPASAPTGADGAFVLEGVPPDRVVHLIARASGSAAALAPTLNPGIVAPGDVEDLFGVELYVLDRGPGSLLDALEAEGLSPLLAGGYVGQAVREVGGALEAAPGVTVHVHPRPGALRYVAALPRYLPDEPVLRPETADATGPFGLFVAEADGPEELVAVAPVDADGDYDVVVTPLPAGVVVYGVHRAR